MSETIVFDTEQALKGEGLKTEKIATFKLLPETSPILREVLPEFNFSNPPVNPNEFASSLVETCKENNGYGLSANQCGFKHRVFVMGTGDEYVAFFNPKVVQTYGESHIQEACLSFPLLGLYITRPAAIDVEYQDYNGEKRTAHYTGISARCFLHEIDHMNGVLYTDKVKPLALQMGLKKRTKTMQKFKKYVNLQAKQVKNANTNRVR